MSAHIPHPRIKERAKIGPHLTKHEHIGLNGRLAMLITNMVSTMWCAYLFAIIALISLPAAIEGGTATIVSWIAQTFLQLVLLSVIMVGQKVAARASDKQALQTFKDTEAVPGNSGRSPQVDKDQLRTDSRNSQFCDEKTKK